MNLIKYEYDFHRNYELLIKKDVYKTHGLCGLINMGNKCYLNSILQCLSNSLKLTDYFLTCKYKEDLDVHSNKNEHYFLNSYVSLINHIWDQNQLIKPKSIVENLGKFYRKYYGVQQQDSHECLLYILDILHKSISYEIEVEIKGEVRNRKDELMKKSLETWKNFYEKEYSFIIELFYGNLINNIRCNNNKCNFIQEVFEPYNTLSLTINNSSTLQECLDDYFENEVNYHITTWRCDKCNENGCNKSSSLWTLPNYIIINFSRFQCSVSKNNFCKNNKSITFPIDDLDLSKYVYKDKQDLNNYIYDLYAVNYHQGELNNGHYWSTCKNLDGNWYSYNDGNVSKLSERLDNENAYILMYHRKFIKKTLQI